MRALGANRLSKAQSQAEFKCPDKHLLRRSISGTLSGLDILVTPTTYKEHSTPHKSKQNVSMSRQLPPLLVSSSTPVASLNWRESKHFSKEHMNQDLRRQSYANANFIVPPKHINMQEQAMTTRAVRSKIGLGSFAYHDNLRLKSRRQPLYR